MTPCRPRGLNRSLSFALAIALAAGVCRAQEIGVTPGKPGGEYAVGEKIEWTVDVRGDNAAAAVKDATYEVKRGGLTVIKHGKLDLSGGKATVDAALDAPDAALVVVKAKANGKDVVGLGGAIVEPGKIQPSLPPPDDFDAFWTAKLKELADVPPNPQLEPADAGKPGVEYFKLRMDNVRGTHVYGQLAKPKKEGKFPALLIVQWAGVYGLPKSNVVNRAEQGWLALNVMAHDLPFDQPEAFYKEAAATKLKDYLKVGGADRDANYFLRMYLGCYRAADYLATRPDWDGRTLVVMGTSQGGQQSIVTAGIHPKVTAMLANVPAGCDVTAPKAGRAAGFPYFADNARWSKDDKILEAARYYDAAHFAARIKCPALVSYGLLDASCPPAGVAAAVNQMKGPTEVLVLYSDHQGKNDAQAPYFKRSEEWLRTLVKGENMLPTVK